MKSMTDFKARYGKNLFYAFLEFPILTSGVPRNFVRGGVQQIQLRTEGRENGDLGAVAP